MSNLQWKILSVKVWINLRSNVKRLDVKGFLQEHSKVNILLLIFTLKKNLLRGFFSKPDLI